MKYDKKLTPKTVRQQMSKGRTIQYICKNVLKVQRITFYKWLKDPDKPEFAEAVAMAKMYISDEADVGLMKLMKGGIVTEVILEPKEGKLEITKKIKKKILPDLNAIKYYKNNIDPTQWADKKTVQHEGEVDLKHTIPAEVQEILDEIKHDKS